MAAKDEEDPAVSRPQSQRAERVSAASPRDGDNGVFQRELSFRFRDPCRRAGRHPACGGAASRSREREPGVASRATRGAASRATRAHPTDARLGISWTGVGREVIDAIAAR